MLCPETRSFTADRPSFATAARVSRAASLAPTLFCLRISLCLRPATMNEWMITFFLVSAPLRVARTNFVFRPNVVFVRRRKIYFVGGPSNSFCVHPGLRTHIWADSPASRCESMCFGWQLISLSTCFETKFFGGRAKNTVSTADTPKIMGTNSRQVIVLTTQPAWNVPGETVRSPPLLAEMRLEMGKYSAYGRSVRRMAVRALDLFVWLTFFRLFVVLSLVPRCTGSK